jgi:YhcH/YjgK/YiaL family protein
MIIDLLTNADLYNTVHQRLSIAFHYLKTTDLLSVPTGKHAIEGDDVFAIMQEYETLDADTQQMEAHKKYIDVQYMIQGAELVGHSLLTTHVASKAYDEDGDYHLFAAPPDFFSEMKQGMFMIFFPHDLHKPSIQVGTPAKVRKVVVKVKIAP